MMVGSAPLNPKIACRGSPTRHRSGRPSRIASRNAYCSGLRSCASSTNRCRKRQRIPDAHCRSVVSACRHRSRRSSKSTTPRRVLMASYAAATLANSVALRLMRRPARRAAAAESANETRRARVQSRSFNTAAASAFEPAERSASLIRRNRSVATDGGR